MQFIGEIFKSARYGIEGMRVPTRLIASFMEDTAWIITSTLVVIFRKPLTLAGYKVSVND